MSWVQTAMPAVVAFVGGGTLREVLKKFRTKGEEKNDDSVIEARVAQAALHQAEAARKLQEMAMNLVQPYQVQVTDLAKRLETVEQEQKRVTGLFRQAVEALRDFIDIAAKRGIRGPEMSAELMAEISGG